MAKDLHQHKHSKLRAAGVELLVFVVGLAALVIGYRLAGWPGALLAVALAAVTIFREANRRGAPRNYTWLDQQRDDELFASTRPGDISNPDTW